MKKLVLLAAVSFTFSLCAQEVKKADALVSPRIAGQTITVGGTDADIAGYHNRSIQFAIDAIQKTGGKVVLNPGTYEIKAPVRMKSNITLAGAGETTVLKRDRGVQTKYIIDADYGELKLTVENADGFEIGMKIQVTDNANNGCWNVSTAYITDIEDNVIYIDKGLIRDYRSDLDGLVSNASSVIDVMDAENATVSNLVIDGNRAENYFADGCNSAGVLIQRSKHIMVDHVTVKDFNGEGISWQITEHVTISNCEVSGSGNTGLHPGTGSPFSVIEHNNVHHNDRDGLFICWRVYQGRVTGNEFHHNGRFGICTGHKDTDVVFENNHIHHNRSDGVNLRPERESNAPHRNTFVRNIIGNNGTAGGGFGFSIQSPARELVLKENIFRNSSKTQKAAIYIYRTGLKPTLVNNRFDPHELGDVVFDSLYQRSDLLQHRVIPTKEGRDSMAFCLMLPPSYPNDRAAYPVIYYLHGLGDEYDGTLSQYLADFFMKQFRDSNFPEAIMVFPDGEDGTWVDHHDGDPSLESDVTGALIPYIEKAYRTEPSNRLIMGWSAGGHGALYFFTKYPGLFKGVVSLDGSIVTWEEFLHFEKERANQITNADSVYFYEHCSPYPWVARNRQPLLQKTKPSIFLAASFFIPTHQRFLSVLQDLDIPYSYHEMDCGHELGCVMSEVSDELLMFISRVLGPS